MLRTSYGIALRFDMRLNASHGRQNQKRLSTQSGYNNKSGPVSKDYIINEHAYLVAIQSTCIANASVLDVESESECATRFVVLLRLTNGTHVTFRRASVLIVQIHHQLSIYHDFLIVSCCGHSACLGSQIRKMILQCVPRNHYHGSSS